MKRLPKSSYGNPIIIEQICEAIWPLLDLLREFRSAHGIGCDCDQCFDCQGLLYAVTTAESALTGDTYFWPEHCRRTAKEHRDDGDLTRAAYWEAAALEKEQPDNPTVARMKQATMAEVASERRAKVIANAKAVARTAKALGC